MLRSRILHSRLRPIFFVRSPSSPKALLQRREEERRPISGKEGEERRPFFSADLLLLLLNMQYSPPDPSLSLLPNDGGRSKKKKKKKKGPLVAASTDDDDSLHAPAYSVLYVYEKGPCLELAPQRGTLPMLRTGRKGEKTRKGRLHASQILFLFVPPIPLFCSKCAWKHPRLFE